MKKFLFAIALTSAMGLVSCDEGDIVNFAHELTNYKSRDLFIGTKDLSGEWLNYNFCDATIDLKCEQSKKYAFITSVDTTFNDKGLPEKFFYHEDLNDSIAKYVGPEYRLPTLAEFQNLLQRAARRETTFNGVAGYVFKCNDKTLFFPYGTYLTGSVVSGNKGEERLVYVYKLAKGDAITYDAAGNNPQKAEHYIRPVRKLAKEMK
ncbi:hypothetical protein [Sodaliphilus sp.]|uniref:hypothetical protein n=1 Tax=Sodaliphilus sp. TaxID=2815818 RepID=UPI00388FAB23